MENFISSMLYNKESLLLEQGLNFFLNLNSLL